MSPMSSVRYQWFWDEDDARYTLDRFSMFTTFEDAKASFLEFQSGKGMIVEVTMRVVGEVESAE